VRALRFLRGNILVLTIIQTLGMFCRSMVFPYASLYILALGGEPAQIGIINSISPLLGLIVFPLGGYLADRAGRVKMISISSYVGSAILLLFVIAPNWQWIAVARLLQGFMVIQFPATSAIIADSLTSDTRGRGVATMNTLSTAFAIVAPYIAGALIDAQGAERGGRILYGVMMATTLIIATIYLTSLRETARPDPAKGKISLIDILRRAYGDIPATLRGLSRSLKALTGIVLLGFIANGIASSFWVVYAQDEIGLSSSSWGLILLLETLLRCLAYIPAGYAVDHWGRVRCVIAALVVALVTMPAFVFAGGFWQVLAIRAAIAVAQAFFTTACSALMADAVPPQVRGRVMAAVGRGTVMLGAASGGTGGPGVGFVITIPLMIASLAGGYLYEYNTAYPWFVAAGTTIVSIALGALYLRDPRAESDEAWA
jgi:MFS family permease